MKKTSNNLGKGINTVIPVIVSFEKHNPVLNKRFQGFTRHLGEKHISLEIHDLEGNLNDHIKSATNYNVEMLLPNESFTITSKVNLINVQSNIEENDKHNLSFSFLNTDNDFKKKISRFINKIKVEKYKLISVVILCLYFIFFFYLGLSEINQNSQKQIGQILIENKMLKKEYKNNTQQFEDLAKQKNKLLLEIQNYQNKIKQSEIAQKELADTIQVLQKEIPLASSIGKNTLRKNLDFANLQKKEIENNYLDFEKKKNTLLNEMQKLNNSNPLQKGMAYQLILKNGEQLNGVFRDIKGSEINLQVENGTLNISKNMLASMTLLGKKTFTELNNFADKIKIPKTLDFLPPVIKKYPESGVTIHNNRIYVNGNLFYIKGVSYAVSYPNLISGMKSYNRIPQEVFEKDFRMMKIAGINVIRTYEPLNEKLLDLAWKNGIRVIENICYPNEWTDYKSDNYLQHYIDNVITVVKAHKNHPAILMWSIWNDAPWVFGTAGNPVEHYGYSNVNNFLKKIYMAVKSADSTHPVTASNVLGFVGSDLGRDYLDVIGFNAYIGGMDAFVPEDGVNTVKEIKNISEKYNKPVVILETGYSTLWGRKKEQAKVLSDRIKTIGINLAGLVVFQWSDGWDKAGNPNKQDDETEEHWGIVDGYRTPKPGYESINKMFNYISTESLGYSLQKN